MTYLEYAAIVCPEHVGPGGFVSGCPEVHRLPRVPCSDSGCNCARCYASHIVPDDMVDALLQKGMIDEFDVMTESPVSSLEILALLGLDNSQ